MLRVLIDNRFAVTAVILFVTGFVNMMVHPNLIKKVVAFNIMDSATFLMLASRGMIAGRTAAILTDGGADPSRYVNPIPAGLVLTGIVVSVACSAVFLALTVRLYRRYHSLNIDEIIALSKEGEE